MIKRLLTLMSLSFCIFASGGSWAQSCSTDAEYTGTQTNDRAITSTEVTGQSFQAGTSGALHSVSIDLSADNQNCNLSTIDLLIEIVDGDGTGGTVLTSQLFTIPVNITRTMETFTFNSPASLNTGQMYTVVLSLAGGQNCGNGEPNLIWYFEFPTNYWNNTGGTQYYGSTTPSLGNTQYFSTCVGCQYSTPTGDTTQTFCDSATVADLSATGNNITWYPTSTSTTALNSMDPLTDGDTYYATNTDNGCESPTRFDVTVTINNSPSNTVTNADDTLTADEAGATYQWIDCDDGNAPINGATNQSFAPSEAGNYAVEITKNGCTSTSDCESFSFANTESIHLSEFSVYPNPTESEFTLSSSQEGSISIMNAQGKTVYNTTVKAGKTHHNLPNLSAGVYWLQFTGAQSTQMKKLVVQ